MLTPSRCREITLTRLEAWADLLHRSSATPLMLIGAGQGTHEGDLVVCHLEDMTRTELSRLLVEVMRELSRRGGLT